VFRNSVVSRRFVPEVEQIARQRAGRKFVKKYFMIFMFCICY